MIRRLRWLLPVVILAILGAVGAVYLKQRELLEQGAPKRPKLLESGVEGSALDWCYDQARGSKSRVQICASKMNNVDGRIDMQGVQLKLFHENAQQFDLVTSELAQFTPTDRKLFSDGDVQITLAVPVEGAPPGRLLKIHSSGVEFSSETGEATTSRAVSFEFNTGGGSAVGAHYNPANRQLRMDSQVVLDWRGKRADAQPMHIEAGQAWYLESENKVLFPQWAKLTRSTLQMDTGNAEVHLNEGEIERADMHAARGTQISEGRSVQYAAEDIHMLFDEHMTVKTILAERDARLISTATNARTTVTADRLDLNFVANNNDSVLTTAVATGKSVVNAEPIVRPGAASPETRVLKSDVVWMFMRPGGEEIDRVETPGPGTLDFLPNRPDQVKRNLKGDQIWINYGSANRIEKFRSINAVTRTELQPARVTESKEILAFFDANSTLTRLEQNTDFRYQEGDRRANARKASMEQATNLLVLDGAASTSDPTGKVNADKITLDQKTGNYTAEGNVSTTRQPSKKGGSSAMLSNEEVMQATAKRMTATDNNQKIHYEGDAKAWQGANRVTADRLDIDQITHIMQAHGKVETQFFDKNTKSGPAISTMVRASDLEYSSETRIAHYTGGVHLERPSLVEDSKELRAYMKNTDSDSSLEKAIADGAVKIVSSTPVPGKGKRIRTGTSEHAEYYVDEQRVLLNGGQPLLVDSEKGRTTGCQLTWWANNDRLRVDGGQSCKVETVIPKK